MSFAVAQVFFVDPATCLAAPQVTITEIQLYFRAKPRITGNKSGIYSPGVMVGIVPTQFGVPLIGQTGVDTQIDWSRQEWGSIKVTADASMSTRFRWETPQLVQTGKQFAIIVKYDGDEDFLIWTNKTGDNLVGTTNRSPGVSGHFIGNLYTYISPLGSMTGTGIGYSNSTGTSNSLLIPSISNQSPSTVQLSQEYLLSTWRAIDNTDLKFRVAVARYFHNGVPVSSNTSIAAEPSIIIYGSSSNNFSVVSNNVLRVTAPSAPVEYIRYDKASSSDSPLSFGDLIYQDQPYWSGGKSAPATVGAVTGDRVLIGNASFIQANGVAFNWASIYPSTLGQPAIVVTSLNHDGAGAHRVNVRRVMASGNNLLALDEPMSFTNASARFFAAPVGRLTSKLRSYGAGGFGAPGKMADIMVLSDTNANSTCRFVNNCIDSYTISSGGTGYNNTDVINITGFENIGAEVSGGYKATANVLTNGSGVITSINFSNNGAGFVNATPIVIAYANSTGGSSNGTTANIVFTYGATLKTEASNSNTYFKGVTVINLNALQIVPLLEINNPAGTTHSIVNRSLYHSNLSANTFTGQRYFVNDDPVQTDFIVQNGKLHNFSSNLIPTIVSRSNQYSIRFANGAVANDAVMGRNYSNNAVYFFDVASNNDFCSISFGGTLFTSTYARYIINNDYTKEETNYGNAWAKHVSTKINFADGRSAEDLLVYLTAYRPAGTDFKVYARIYNSLDDDTFDSKDWTLMGQTDGLGVYSNPNNPSDMKEFTYNFNAFPNTDYVATGSVTTTLDSNTIVGANTRFDLNLAANDVVRLYQPLFPNNYMVGIVGSISSNNSLTLTTPISNNGLVGSGLKMDRIAFPHQAFNDVLNSNVVCYFNSNMVRFDTYDTFQVKVIFLSNNENVIPKIDDVRSIGVTA